MPATNPFSIEAVVATHSEEIKQLALSTQSLIEIAKVAEKHRSEDVNVMKELASGINTLNDKLNGTLALNNDISQLKEDYRILKHDFGKHDQALMGIPILDKDLKALENRVVANETKIGQHEKIIDQATGGAKILTTGGKALWMIFGTGILAIGAFVLWLFFTTPHKPVIQGSSEITIAPEKR